MSNRRKTPAERAAQQSGDKRMLRKLYVRRGMLLRDADRLPSWAWIHHEPAGDVPPGIHPDRYEPAGAR